MAIHRVKLKHREEVAEGTVAFYFEKPDGFQFKAGQFVRLALLNPPETDAEGDTRTFSLTSAPFEEYLIIATRMRNTAFKRVIRSMPLGSEVEIKGAYGRMTLHDDTTRPAVILTGGIGITPFRSIVLEATRAGSSHSIRLFYSNRRPEDAAFLDELKQLEANNPNYRFIPTMTSARDSRREWAGETGRITAELLARFVEDPLSPMYYVAGPQSMVSAMSKTLGEAGVSESDVQVEEFAGY